MRSYSEVQAEIEYVEGELAKLRQEAKEAQARGIVEARKQITQIMKDTGLTAADLLNSKTIDKTKLTVVKSSGDRAERKPSTPQYQDPDSGKTWTGQGRAPKWMKDQDREKFRIQKAA